jgi:hypothetical protein
VETCRGPVMKSVRAFLNSAGVMQLIFCLIYLGMIVTWCKFGRRTFEEYSP